MSQGPQVLIAAWTTVDVTSEFWLEAPWMRIKAMLKEDRVFVGALPADALVSLFSWKRG